MKVGALLEGWKCVCEVMMLKVHGMKGGEEAINLGVLCNGVRAGVCDADSYVCVTICVVLLLSSKVCVSASHKGFSSFAYRADAMRSKLLRAEDVMGALSIADLVASCMYLGTGLRPFACDGQLGEKWSF